MENPTPRSDRSKKSDRSKLSTRDRLRAMKRKLMGEESKAVDRPDTPHRSKVASLDKILAPDPKFKLNCFQKNEVNMLAERVRNGEDVDHLLKRSLRKKIKNDQKNLIKLSTAMRRVAREHIGM